MVNPEKMKQTGTGFLPVNGIPHLKVSDNINSGIFIDFMFETKELNSEKEETKELVTGFLEKENVQIEYCYDNLILNVYMVEIIYYNNMKHRKLKLSEKDQMYLKKMVKKAKEINRGRILLLLDKGMKNEDIADVLDISVSTVAKIKKRYLDEGLDVALNDKYRSGQPKKYDDEKEATVIAFACTDPPKGRKNWTIRLIADEMRHFPGFETITHETVRLILKKAQLSLG